MNKETLIREFSRDLYHGVGALFVGAGISRGSGLPSWLDLLKSTAKSRLGIELTRDDDLPMIAQALVNYSSGNRGPLIHEMTRQLRKPVELNKYHQALARMNVATLWTTNYDTLLERAFSPYYSLDIKVTDADMSRVRTGSQVEIIKIHGCIETSRPEEIVVTQEDYEDFEVRRPATVERLRTELLRRSLLFVGYSFKDPNIANILVQARRLSHQVTRQHYIVLERETEEPLARRQELWLKDLRRVGIEHVLIDTYEDLGYILEHLARASRGPSVYVTGSHLTSEDGFATQLGSLLAGESSVVMLDGQSSGVSRLVLASFTEACIRQGVDVYGRVRLFPNPYAANPSFSNDRTLLPVLRQWRGPLLRSAQVLILFDGGMGTEEELKVARDLGCYIVPVPRKAHDLAHRLLAQDPAIRSGLENRSPGYREKALDLQLTPEDVVTCVKALIDL